MPEYGGTRQFECKICKKITTFVFAVHSRAWKEVGWKCTLCGYFITAGPIEKPTEKRDVWFQKAHSAKRLGDAGDIEAYHRAVDYYQRADQLRWDPASIGYRIAIIASDLAEREELAAAERYLDIAKTIAHDRVDQMCRAFGPSFVKGAVLSGDCEQAESYGREFGLEPVKYYDLICRTLIGEGKFSEAIKWAQKYAEALEQRDSSKEWPRYALYLLMRYSFDVLTGEDQLDEFLAGEICVPAHVPPAKLRAWKRLLTWCDDLQREWGWQPELDNECPDKTE